MVPHAPAPDAPPPGASEGWLLYDGGCPFCAAYVRRVRLREGGPTLRLIDARDGGPQLAEARAAGLDIDTGMVLKFGGRLFHGDECLTRMARLTAPADTFNRLTAWIFRSGKRARRVYPWLARGRNAVLALIGRSKIGAGE